MHLSSGILFDKNEMKMKILDHIAHTRVATKCVYQDPEFQAMMDRLLC